MEQENEPREVIDLSNVFDELNRESQMPVSPPEEKLNNHIPGLYRLIIKLSVGTITTEKQAQTAAIIVIIIANLITFSLLFKDMSNNKTGEMVPNTVAAEGLM